MDGMRHALHTAFKGAAEAVLPVRTESAFAERGVRNRTKRVCVSPPAAACPSAHLGLCRMATRLCRGTAEEGACGEWQRHPDAQGHSLTFSLTPPPPQVLSPAEFVVAGEFLVRACPTWAW